MSESKFMLGNCEVEGKKYEFHYNNGEYSIKLIKDEENFDLLLKTREKEKAYSEWGIIKYPNKKGNKKEQ